MWLIGDKTNNRNQLKELPDGLQTVTSLTRLVARRNHLNVFPTWYNFTHHLQERYPQ